jgi:hypothetical protein
MERRDLGSHSDTIFQEIRIIAKIYLQLYQNGIPTLPFLLIFVVFAKIYLQLYQNGIPTLSFHKKIRLIRSLKKFIFRYQYLVEIYSVSEEKIISDAFSYSENV